MNHVINPVLPYNGHIDGGVFPGRTIKIQGSTFHHSHRFGVNLVCGVVGDIALHVSPNFHDHLVIRNSVVSNVWGHAENHGHNPLHKGSHFEMSIHVEHEYYKISFNGHHFTEFRHRIPFNRVTNLSIEGDLTVNSIVFEPFHGVPNYPGAPGTCPPYPGSHIMPPVHLGGPPVHGGVHPPHHGGVHPPHHGGPPVHGGIHPPQHSGSHGNIIYPPGHAAPGPPNPGFHNPSGLYPSNNNNYNPGYPSPGYPHSPTSHKKDSIVDKAGAALAGALGTTALLGVAGKSGRLGHVLSTVAGHGHSPMYHKKGNIVDKAKMALGGALGGSALLGAAGYGMHMTKEQKKAMKHQRKAQKKALKYGVGIGAAGVGAYALHKAHKHKHHGHHGHSSSSSSSSSSD